MNGEGSNEKPLYCHWDTHDHDVLFMNESELDQHLYSHFQADNKDNVVASETHYEDNKSSQNVECHWDACHEMFDIDQFMEHFRTSHQEHSLHPHHGTCVNEEENCDLKSVNADVFEHRPQAYVRLNPSTSSLSGGVGKNHDKDVKTIIEPSSLPSLNTPESLTFDCHRCMWCMNDGHICGEEFMTSTELNAHIVHTHVYPGSTTCNWTGCERERAPFCQRQKLVRHLQVHAKSLDHKCKVCNKAMSCENQLKNHERQHTHEKPFECTQCGKKFKSRNSLNVHYRVHSGVKPLVCTFPGCGKRFAESSNLAKHRRIHMAPEFECPDCGRKFTRKDHLQRHQKTKHSNSNGSSGSLESHPISFSSRVMASTPDPNLAHQNHQAMSVLHSQPHQLTMIPSSTSQSALPRSMMYAPYNMSMSGTQATGHSLVQQGPVGALAAEQLAVPSLVASPLTPQ